MITVSGIWPALHDCSDNNVFTVTNAGAPISGVKPYGTGAEALGKGSICIDITNAIPYINEGSLASPYWTPVDTNNRHLLIWRTGFFDGVGKALADTAALATIAGSGVRVFGNGVSQTDSGLVVAMGSGVPVASLTASATNPSVAALGVGTTVTVPFSPTTNGPLVVDATVAMSSALTLRQFFIGFLGTQADALVVPVSGTTLTLTNVQADIAGLMMDSNMTAATEIFGTHSKASDTATIASTVADTGVVFPAAGTYARYRVEIDILGNAAFFINKIQVLRYALALTPGTQVAPTLLVASTSAAVKTMLVKRFMTWGMIS